MMEETHYYPFGLTMEGISDKAIKTQYPGNKFRYNGKELQHQEFSDGSGLDEYDYGARFYDPQVGRWNVIDSKSTKFPSYSTYQYCMDNPMLYVDPNGMENVIYLVGTQGVSQKDLMAIRAQINKNFKSLKLKTRAEIFSGKEFTKEMYGKMDAHDAVAIIGKTSAVEDAVSKLDPKMGDQLKKDKDFGPGGRINPEISGNSYSEVNSNENIIAVNTEDAEVETHDFNAGLPEVIAFDITHGAGHNSGLPHAGSQIPGHPELIVPPGSVMTDGNVIQSGILHKQTTLSGYIKTSINQGLVTDYYKARFGDSNANPNKNIPIKKNESDK